MMEPALTALFTELSAAQQRQAAANSDLNYALGGLGAAQTDVSTKAAAASAADTAVYTISERIRAACDGLTRPTAPDPHAMPTAVLPGWRPVVQEDFLTDIPRGGVKKALEAKGFGFYDDFRDTFKGGTYSTDRTSLTKGGDLEINMRTENAVALSFAISPTAWKGQKYGRYAVHFRSDKISERKIAWLLWPENNNWNEGEVNFPEGDCGGDIWGYAHKLNEPAKNQVWVNTGVKMTDWHTCVIEWTPGRLRFLLDGVLVRETVDPLAVPKTNMRWTLQCESSDSAPDPAGAGTIEIAWLTQHAYDPSVKA